MTASKTTDVTQMNAAEDVPSLAAPAGLNLLGDESAGGCCGGGSCAMPGE
ncbi:hypothetical protein [Microbacterium sp.]